MLYGELLGKLEEGLQLLSPVKGGTSHDPVQRLGVGDRPPGLVSPQIRTRDADPLGKSGEREARLLPGAANRLSRSHVPMVPARVTDERAVLEAGPIGPRSQRLKALLPSSQPMSAPVADIVKMISPAPAMARFFMNMAISVVRVGSSSDQK